jgi:hypothetical protein
MVRGSVVAAGAMPGGGGEEFPTPVRRTQIIELVKTAGIK